MDKFSSFVYIATRGKRLFQIKIPRSTDMMVPSENKQKYHSDPDAIKTSLKKFKGDPNKNESRSKQLQWI